MSPYSLMPTLIIIIDLIIFSMDYITMVDFIEMAYTIMEIDALDMDIIIIMEIDIIKDGVIEHVMEYMDIIEIKTIMNVLHARGRNKDVKTEVECIKDGAIVIVQLEQDHGRL